jgi:shikimate dehydrogenase
LEPALALKKTAPNIATLVVEGEVPDVTYDLVVNATRLGLNSSDPDPIDLEVITCKSVYDMVYVPGKTALVRSAIKRGIPASDGLGMLIMQAAFSLQHWFPDQEPPIQAMRVAARMALEEA